MELVTSKKATITFLNNQQAKDFASSWTLFMYSGHVIEGKKVTVYNITNTGKKFIKNYIHSVNNDIELLKSLGWKF